MGSSRVIFLTNFLVGDWSGAVRLFLLKNFYLGIGQGLIGVMLCQNFESGNSKAVSIFPSLKLTHNLALLHIDFFYFILF